MNMTSCALTDLNTLPALPQTVVQLLDACNDKEVEIADIGKIVALDATISGRILQLANSAFLGARTPFAEIGQAVIFLGIDTVRNLALAVSVHELFGDERKSIELPQFWYHSLHTAIIAKQLAEQSNFPEPAQAYLCGLLHDLGKLILATHAPDHDIFSAARPTSADLLLSERRLFGIDHAMLSGDLLRLWRLPENMAQAVTSHHEMADEDGLASLLHQANLISHQACSTGKPTAPCSSPLSPEEVRSCGDAATSMVEEIASAMGLPVTRPAELPTSTAEREESKGELGRRARQLLVLHGALDNLLTAEDEERIFQITEESLELLFGLGEALFILPDEKNDSLLRMHCSSRNPHSSTLGTLSPPAVSSSIGRCLHAREEKLVTREDSDLTDGDHQLITLFSHGQLLAIPLPLSSGERGLLLVALRPDQLARLNDISPTLRSFAGHLGARLGLERLHRRHASRLLDRELAAVEKAARAIAHEIAGPLGVIQNSLTLIERKHAAARDFSKDIAILEDETGRISAITRQLESIHDLTRQKPYTPIRLDQLMRELLAQLRPSHLDPAGIEVQVRLSGATRAIPVQQEPMHEAMTKLLINCAEAMVQGGTICLRSALCASEDHPGQQLLHLTVSDDGPGIPEELVPSIFTVGFGTKGKGHLGLGLSIARKKLMDLGGQIIYQPLEGHGASFLIVVPL